MKMNLLKSALTLACIGMMTTACKDGNETKSKDPNQLPASLVNNPRSADGINQTDLATAPTMDFADTLYDFGQMHDGEKATHNFSFTNNGKRPLLITNAAGSCGCTVPDFPHEPIAPGQSGVINVIFNSSGKSGMQHKSVTLKSNAARGTHVLYITANVISKEEQ